MAAGSVFGRRVRYFIAARIGMFNTLVSNAILTSVVALALLSGRSFVTIVLLSVLHVIVSNALVSVLPALLVQVSPDRSVIGNRMGMAFSTVSLGSLIGTPVETRIKVY